MIRLGTLAGYSFEGPRVLGGWTPPSGPGVYAILYKPDPERERYAVVYVGEAPDLAAVGFPFRHRRAACWTRRAGGKWRVHVAHLAVPGDTGSQRAAIVRELVALYEPHCNEQRFDSGWREEWIGEYSDAPNTAPLPPTDRGQARPPA
ncbi:hypothetical protein [Pseudonocardia sp.]|uniref:hypothetical protein n=1 Tax=Pseudonocardia sp. TaxID=60912 RepID=UPI003D117C2F